MKNSPLKQRSPAEGRWAKKSGVVAKFEAHARNFILCGPPGESKSGCATRRGKILS
jgi:hypothetical protein